MHLTVQSAHNGTGHFMLNHSGLLLHQNDLDMKDKMVNALMAVITQSKGVNEWGTCGARNMMSLFSLWIGERFCSSFSINKQLIRVLPKPVSRFTMVLPFEAFSYDLS